MNPHTITIGLRESKLVIDVLSEAYDKAKRSGYPNVEVKLSNAKFIESVQQLWTYIAKGSTDENQGMDNQSPEEARPRKKAKTTSSGPSKHVILPSLMAKVSDWIEDPLSFFKEDEARLSLNGDPVAETYAYLIKLEKRTELDITRGRLLKVLYHRLRERLGVGRLVSNRVENIAEIISRSGFVKDCDRETVAKWLDEGKRIDGLCRDIGSIKSTGYSYLRNLFYLCTMLDRRIIRLRLDGKSRINDIQQIKANLVYDTAEALKFEELANLLMSTLWEPIKNSIPELQSLEGTQQIPIFQVQDDCPLLHNTQTSTSFSTTSQNLPEGADTPSSPIRDPARIASGVIFSGGEIPSETVHTAPTAGRYENGNVMDHSGAITALLDSFGVSNADWEGNVVTGVSDAGLMLPLIYPDNTLSTTDVYWDDPPPSITDFQMRMRNLSTAGGNSPVPWSTGRVAASVQRVGSAQLH